jgi:hypothetical protein
MAFSTWKVTVVQAGFGRKGEAACPMKTTRPAKMIPALCTSCRNTSFWKSLSLRPPGERGGGSGGRGIQTGEIGTA